MLCVGQLKMEKIMMQGSKKFKWIEWHNWEYIKYKQSLFSHILLINYV